MNIKGRIEDWIISSSMSPYTSPEGASPYIEGILYDRSDDGEDGKHIKTSSLIGKTDDPSIIETKTGSFYKLGNPRPSYVEWCRKEKVHIPTKEQPILWEDKDE